MSKSESEAATVSDESGSAALSPDRGVSSTSLDTATESPIVVVKVPTDLQSCEAEVTSTSSGTCTSWNLTTLGAALEEKDPFLGMSEEDMNRLDSVLFSEEGQKVFETSVPAAATVVACKGHVTASTTVSHLTSELPDLNAIGHSDFVIDDVIIQEGLKEDLSAFADSFGDHGYCANPEQVSIAQSLSNTSVAKEERDARNLKEEKEETTDENSRDEASTNLPIRRSTRIQDHRQHQEAEQIMQENMEKERKAKKSLSNDGLSETPKKIPPVKHYNMRTKRPPRDYPDFVTPKQQRSSRAKIQESRGNGNEEAKTDKANNTQSDVGSSGGEDRGNTTGSKGQRSVRGKTTRARSGRACKKETEESDNEVEGESMEGTSPRKAPRRKNAKSKNLGNEKTKIPLSSSSDSENETLGEIRNRTKRLCGTRGKQFSVSSDAPLSVVKGKLKEEVKMEDFKEEIGDNLSSHAVVNKDKSKDASSDNAKLGRGKKEEKLKLEIEGDKDMTSSEHVVKSKKRIRKGRKKERDGGDKTQKEGEAAVAVVPEDDELDSSPTGEGDSDTDWGSEDDPDRLWCICKKPYANRFMICCDECKDWFHGSCMGLTRKQGTDIVRKNHTWLCPKCTDVSRKIRERYIDSSSESTDMKLATATPDKGIKPSESTISISSVGTDRLAESDTKTEEPFTGDKEEDSVKSEAGGVVKTKQPLRPPERLEIEALQEQLQELKRRRQHRVAGPNDAVKEETKTRTKSMLRTSLDDRRGSVDDRRGSAKDRLGSAEDRRGSVEDRRGSVEDRRGSVEDRRGSVEDRRGSVEDRVRGKNKGKPKVSRKDCCISTDCGNRARPGSVYCSDACITTHAQESLRLIGSEHKKTYGNRSQLGTGAGSGLAASERIVVFDRKTGKIVTGPVAPTASNLESWLSRHPAFEVLRPGSQVTQNANSFYGMRANKKEKPQPKRPDPNKIKEVIQKLKPPVKDVNSSTLSRHDSMPTSHQRDSASSNLSRDHRHSVTKVHASKPHPSIAVSTRQHPSVAVPTRSQPSVAVPTRSQPSVAVSTREPIKSRPRVSSGEHLQKSHEVKARRDSHSAKKTKYHHEQETVAPPTELNFGPDPVRISIRKTLRDLLNKRADDADDIMLSGAEIKQLALDIEEELFKYYGGVTSKYKNKYRSLVFNVKDPKNKGLFRKVMNAEIKPYDLVRLTSEQLASKELAMWREQETKHSLEMIEKSEKEIQKTQVIKKTHKGEVVVEDEDLSILENKAETPSEVTGNVLVDDTTMQHKNHLFDLNCKICTGKMAPPADDEMPPQKRVHIGKTVVCGENKLSRLEEITIGEIRQRSQDEEINKNILCEDEDDYEEEEEEEEEEPVATSSDSVLSAKLDNEDTDSLKKLQTAAESQDQRSQSESGMSIEGKVLLKSCLKGKLALAKSVLNESSAVAVSTTTVSSPDSAPSSSVEVQPSLVQDRYVWKGYIIIQEMLKFVTVAYHVSGPTDHLKEELPSTIDVRGRISPEQVWDYLSRLRHMIGTMRELTVIRFKYVTMEEKSSYMQLYSYLSSRNRCGVIGCVSRIIKDMYLVPLASHDPIPSVLLPFDGPGLELNRPHILLGILIKQKVKRPQQAGPRNIYTVRPEFRDKGGPVTSEVELPAKRICLADNDSAVTPSVTARPHPKMTEPHRSLSGKETSPDSVVMEISEKQRNDPIVKEYALADPRTFSNEPAPGSSPYSPPEDDVDEDEPYDPEYGLDSPVAMATTEKTDVVATNITTPASVHPPGGSSIAGVGSLMGQLVGGATTPTEITAAMLATLAGSSGLDQQRKVLMQLTKKVEEQKRALQQQMQRNRAPGPTSLLATEPIHVDPTTVALTTPAVSAANPSISSPLVTSDLYAPKPNSGLGIVTKTHILTVAPVTDNKIPPDSSKDSASNTLPPELPLEVKKVADVVPNVARKRLAEKAGVSSHTSAAPLLSGNLSLLPASVRLLLSGGAVPTLTTGSDERKEPQPAVDASSFTTAEVKSPLDITWTGDKAQTVKDAKKPEQDNSSDTIKIKLDSVEEFTKLSPSDETASIKVSGAHNPGSGSNSETMSRLHEADPVVLNPHGDVDYRIAPASHFPAAPQTPPGRQSSWQAAFQTKPQEVTSSTTAPKSSWVPTFLVPPPQKPSEWVQGVPTTQTSWAPAFPANAPHTARPADPRQKAVEERTRKVAHLPSTGSMDGPCQGEGGIRPPMWNVRPPGQSLPIPPWDGTLPRARFGAQSCPPPRMRMPLLSPPPSIPNAVPMLTGDIDERVRPMWPPGVVVWQPSEVQPPLPPPRDNTKPAAVPSVDLSALGKFAVEFLKEQKQKEQGAAASPTSNTEVRVPLPCSTTCTPLPANALGKSQSVTAVSMPSARTQVMPLSSIIHGVSPSDSVQVRLHPSNSVREQSDTDERHRNNSSHVTRSTADFQNVLLSRKPTDPRQSLATVASSGNQKDTRTKCVLQSEDHATQSKLKTAEDCGKSMILSDKREAETSVAVRSQIANSGGASESSKTKSKWVPLGVSLSDPQNRVAAASTTQPTTGELIVPSPGTNGAKPTKVPSVPIKQIGISFVETKTLQVLNPVEAKPLLSSLAEVKRTQKSVDDPGVKTSNDVAQIASTDAQLFRSQSKVGETVTLNTDNRSSRESTSENNSVKSGKGVSLTEHGSTRSNKDDKAEERMRGSRTSSTRSSGAGRHHRTRSRSRDRQKKERGRSRSRDRQSGTRRDRRPSRSRSRGHDRHATKHCSRSRSRDRDDKRRSRSRDRAVKRKTRSRSRDRGVKRRSPARSRDVKRRSRSKSRDRDTKRRSRSRSRERHASFRSDRSRHERRVESEDRRSPPASRHAPRERAPKEDHLSNDEVFSHSQDVDHRAAGHGDCDERFLSDISVPGGQFGHTDAATPNPAEKLVLEGTQDTDERVATGRPLLASPFVQNTSEHWLGRPPQRDSGVGDARTSGDKDDRDRWRRVGGPKLFPGQQTRLDPAAAGLRVQSRDDLAPRPLGDRPFMPPPPGDLTMTSRPPPGDLTMTSRPPPGDLTMTHRPPPGDLTMTPRPPPGDLTMTPRPPPGDLTMTPRPPPGDLTMTPRPPPGWMPPMIAPRRPLMRLVRPPGHHSFPPRGPNRGWPRGPPGGRRGPW